MNRKSQQLKKLKKLKKIGLRKVSYLNQKEKSFIEMIKSPSKGPVIFLPSSIVKNMFDVLLGESIAGTGPVPTGICNYLVQEDFGNDKRRIEIKNR